MADNREYNKYKIFEGDEVRAALNNFRSKLLPDPGWIEAVREDLWAS